MAKSSKQTSGSAKAPVNKYHAAPIGKGVSAKGPTKSPSSSPIMSQSTVTLTSPTINAKTQVLQEIDSRDIETSTSNTEARIFTSKTGIPNDRPVIIASSEFIPLKESPQDKVLSLKETSRSVNDKTARAVLAQEPEVKDYVDSNVSDLLLLIDRDSEFKQTLINKKRETLSALDITSFALPNRKNSDSVGSLYEILLKSGFSSNDIVQFTETKVWMQALVELKRLLLCHSPDLVMQKFPTSSVNKDSKKKGQLPFFIENVTNPSDNLKRIWINPYYNNLPSRAQITTISTLSTSAAQLQEFQRNQYINLSSANGLPKKTVNTTKEPPGISPDQKNAKPMGSSTLDTYVESGRDISIIANCLFKELNYSFLLYSNDSNYSGHISQKFGYTVSPTGDNFQIWDHIIGRFPESVLTFPDNPTGLGNSLVSFSQKRVNIANQLPYKVLTFENNFLESSDATPGSYYYIDSSLQSLDANNTFLLFRLDELIKRTTEAHDTTKVILFLLGYYITPIEVAIEGVKERYEKSEAALTRPASSLRGVLEYLSQVTTFYGRVVTIDEGGGTPPDEGGGHAAEVASRGQFRGIDFSALSEASKEDNVNTRLAALICKLAVSPTKAYEKRSQEIRTNLFMLFMNIVMNQVDKVSNSGTITELKNKLKTAVFLPTTQKTLSKSEMDAAYNEGRTFVGSVNYLDAVYAAYEHVDLVSEEYGKTFVKDEYDPGKNMTLPPDYVAMWDSHVNGRYFNLEKTLNTGLWKSIVTLMKDVYSHQGLFVNNGSNTGYSGMSKMAYMYSYFDMLMRVIAAQCPENIKEAYKYQDEIKDNAQLKFGDIADYTQVKTLKFEENGLLIDKVTASTLNEYFDTNANAKVLNLLRPIPMKCTRLQSALNYLEEEENHTLRQVSVFRTYLDTLNKKLNSFRSFLSNDNFIAQRMTDLREMLTRQLANSSPNEAQPVASEDLVKAAINVSFGEEQILLTRYIASEYRDKCITNDTSSKLKSLPFISDNSPKDNYSKFYSVNETDHISYTALRSYFDGPEFSKESGFNKKILSVGIPPGMLRNLVGSVRLASDNVSGHRQRIIRMKVYKMDRLHPDLVYLPREYLFDMSRFPTRILANWHKESIDTQTTDLRTIPMKVMHPDGRVSREKDITEAFKPNDYGTFLDDQEKSQIYSNHATSFICEEYLRWFTDCRFEESRYYHFGSGGNFPYNTYFPDATNQYVNFVNAIKGKKIKQYPTDPNSPTYPQEVLPNAQSADVNYTLSQGGLTYEFAWKDADPFPRAANKKFKVPLDSTMLAYFSYETLFMAPNTDFFARLVLPRKFDRVFHVIVDPDDFYIDESMTDPSVLQNFKKLGGLVGGDLDNNPATTLYKHRDTSPDDITLDEYFVTIEPFDYVEQQEV